MNTFGRILRLTSFGESHGPAIGGVLDGFPSGVKIDFQALQAAMDRRSPASPRGSGRQEADKVEILSGVMETENGETVSLGTPVGFIIRNTDVRSKDYEPLKHAFRPGHADDTYFYKYGIRDWRGGGRASARETAVRVAAGALAMMFLEQLWSTDPTVSEHGRPRPCNINGPGGPFSDRDVRAPLIQTKVLTDPAAIADCKAQHDSIGGTVECIVENMPRNLGQPVYDKLTARLAGALMSIPAARSVEFGAGVKASSMRGSEHNDRWNEDGTTVSNICGGTRGGISTGEPLVLRVAFKPIASIAQPQNLLTEDGRLQSHTITGRHDVCCAQRAAAVVEAVTALTLADFVLLDRCSRL